MQKYFQFFCLFLTSLLLSSCADHVTTHGQSFWVNHSIITVLLWTFFPRLMFWFGSAMTGGFLFWVGVFIVPRLMAAFWLTFYYMHTNPILCILAWMVALSGETGEKTVATKSV